jgi:hypothetical protein
LVRETDGEIFALWLKGLVADRIIQIYGPRPIPPSAMEIFSRSLNVSWGHVACFEWSGDKMKIDTLRRANQELGLCK